MHDLAQVRRRLAGLTGLGTTEVPVDPRHASFRERNNTTKSRPFDRRKRIRSGAFGTKETVAEMVRLSTKGARDLVVKLLVVDALEGVKGRDHEAVCRRIFDWVQDGGSGERSGLKFLNDAWQVEQVWEPWIVLCVGGAADCDDHATATSAFCMSVGVPCFIRTVKVNPDRPDLFSHVYAVAVLRDGRELPLDTSVPHAKPGTEPKTKFGTRDWPIAVPEEDDRE